MRRSQRNVVWPNDFSGDMASGLRGQLEIYRTLAGNVDCFFLDDESFNAAASLYEGRYSIGINIGAPLLTARYAYCLLSDPAMLPSIGNPKREEVDPDVIERLRSPLDPWDARGWGFGRSLPRDPKRVEAAKQLSIAAYLFLFFHELNHVELGHLDFAIDHLGISEYREINAAPIEAEDAAILRAFELEADLAALYRSLKVWRAMIPSFDDPVMAILDPEDSWFLAVELLFWVMEFVQPPGRVRALATHPSPVVRRLNAQDATAKVDWVSEMKGPSPLIPWIARNGFSPRALADPLHRSPDRAEPELVETLSRLATLVPVLEPYRRFSSGRD
ncbi:MAG: hypothetical protein WDZ46_10090 [Solirubrobacterales bacterium]